MRPTPGHPLRSSLGGIRVLDFTWNGAGPMCTRVLATLGAEVLKVESATRPDPYRSDSADWGSGLFVNMSLGKSSITLDAKTAEGSELIERLVRKSDVVVESFASGTLERWGFGYDHLIELNPKIIYTTITGFGHSGPYRTYVAYGPTAQAYCGLTQSSGLPDQPPAGWGYAYLDQYTGYMAAAWTIAAIRQRDMRSGPIRLDISQAEVGASLQGVPLLDRQLNGRTLRDHYHPPGNRAMWPGSPIDAGGARGEMGAPYGLYPTMGSSQDDYCAIAVLSDEEWKILCKCMGSPDWTNNAEFDSAEGRIAAQDILDQRLADWTRGYEKYELMEMLAAVGLRAGALQNARDRIERDSSLASRDVFPEIHVEDYGIAQFEALPLRSRHETLQPRSTWAVLDAATKSVLSGVLDLSEGDIARLIGEAADDGSSIADQGSGQPSVRTSGND